MNNKLQVFVSQVMMLFMVTLNCTQNNLYTYTYIMCVDMGFVRQT